MKLSTVFNKAATWGFRLLIRAPLLAIGIYALVIGGSFVINPPSDVTPANDHTFNVLRPGSIFGNTVAVPYIIKEGKAPTYTGMGRLFFGDYEVNWNSDDLFIQSVDSIEERAQMRINNSFTANRLFKKDTWSKNDRAQWEYLVCNIVSQEMAKTPGLGKYRSNGDSRRETQMNDLASDIKNNTTEIEFDCEAMSLVESVILQRLDNFYLPANNEDHTIYKAATVYFYATGQVLFEGNDDIGGHAFIISHATGNIIEGTARNTTNPYRQTLNEGYSVADYIKGEAAVCYDRKSQEIDVYTTNTIQHFAEKAREDMIEKLKKRQETQPATKNKAPKLNFGV